MLDAKITKIDYFMKELIRYINICYSYFINQFSYLCFFNYEKYYSRGSDLITNDNEQMLYSLLPFYEYLHAFLLPHLYY